MTHLNNEALFDEKLKELIPLVEDYVDYDLVVGLPFCNEKEGLIEVLKSVDNVLQSWMGSRQLIVLAGDACGQESLDIIKEVTLKHSHLAFLMPEQISGRGSSIRAIMAIAKKLEADLILLSSNTNGEHGPGIDASVLESLITPIRGRYDLVLGNLRRHHAIDSIAHMFAAPILESFYGSRVSDPLGGIYAITHDFLAELFSESKFWGKSIYGYGIDFWLITRALAWNKNICEVNMPGSINLHSLEERNQIFSENAHSVFEGIRRDSAIWLQDRLIIKVADILARSEVEKADLLNYPSDELIKSFRFYLEKHSSLLEGNLSTKNISELKKLSELKAEEFNMQDETWVDCILDLALAYTFNEEMQSSILELMTGLYNGRIASYANKMLDFEKQVNCLTGIEKDEILVKKMDTIYYKLANAFWKEKPGFNKAWLLKTEQTKPPLIPLGYMEYVPNRPIVVPKKMVGKDKRVANSDDIFRQLRKKYESKFDHFLKDSLNLSQKADSEQIIIAVAKFMQEIENALDSLLPGDLHQEKGVKEFVNALFALIPHQAMFTVSSDILREMIIRFPPINLMIPLGFYSPSDLIANMDPRDAVTYANLVESISYTDRDIHWMVEHIKPESFERVDIKAIVLSEDIRFAIPSRSKVANLNRVTARIAVKPLDAGKGGKYPKLRYFTSILRLLCVAEHYSKLFETAVRERKNIGKKVYNSLISFKKGDDFSAQNIFENYHHRALVNKIRQTADKLEFEGDKKTASIFHKMADGYGLSQLLENERFLTCTAWSWASYSFKGGLKIPTPLTTSVENRWFNHDFLENLYDALGYDVDEIMQIIFRLIQAGKGSQNMLDTLLPARPKDVAVVVQETTNEPSKQLKRYSGNPILEPILEHKWESKYILNPGSLRIKDKVYLFYRAVGDDDVSHIGLAISDGYKILERLPEPIFSPETPEEKMGCEDPRLIIIDDEIIMLYTAYDGNIAQIAAASLKVEDFLKGNYYNWERKGLAFKNIWDKDAILFPEKIKDKYIIYHRIEPSIWVTYMNEVKFPCTEKHAIIIGPRPGRMWDSLKIGAGAQPLKTKYGWLLIYHGVDFNYVYRLGVILVALDNPQKVIYRSPNPILEPEEDYEIGMDGAWVPNVVFTCGAVGGEDKEILEDDDEILVYYGAADTSIGVATATLADLIPEKFRQV